MRRKDRELTDPAAIRRILDESRVCRLGLVDDGVPYVVPLNFGYDWNGGAPVFYFHSAREGRKIDLLRRGGAVCVEIDRELGLVGADSPCEYGFSYESVIGEGTARFLPDAAEKAAALTRIMLHQTGKLYAFTEDMTQSVEVFAVTVEKLSGKARPASS